VGTWGAGGPNSEIRRPEVTAQGERLLAALDAEIKNLSKQEHELARTRFLLQQHATKLRLGVDAELVMTALRRVVPHETALALMERVDPVLSTPADPGRTKV